VIARARYLLRFEANFGFRVLKALHHSQGRVVKFAIEAWRCHYNAVRPHSSLGYSPPAHEAIVWPATTMAVKMPALNQHSNRTTL
jgi:transposase InsO family protein